MLTWIGEFRPGNKTIWVVFDEESDVLGRRMEFLHPNLVLVRETVPYTILSVT